MSAMAIVGQPQRQKKRQQAATFSWQYLAAKTLHSTLYSVEGAVVSIAEKSEGC